MKVTKSDAILELSHVTVRFGGNAVLRDFSFSMAPGECVGLIGPNGCGKSTVLNVIGGFVTPKSGTVYFGGTDISKKEPFVRARLGMGRVFQHCGVFKDLSVRENLIVALDSRGLSLSEEAIKEALSQVGLERSLDKLAGDLSGGQQRLLELVRAKVYQPKILLLDEPTAGVSPRLKKHVLDYIAQIRGEGCSILVVEHDMQFIQNLCPRLVMLYEGAIALDGNAEQVRGSELVREVYLGK